MNETWEKEYPGTCDICGKEKPLELISPGVECGWKSGYVCDEHSPATSPPMNSDDTSQPEASKLPTEYDTALLGCTVSTQEPDRFAYSLKTLIGLVMLDRQCQEPEARQIIFHELIQPFGGEITFIDDSLLQEQPVEKSKIIVPRKTGPRRWQ